MKTPYNCNSIMKRFPSSAHEKHYMHKNECRQQQQPLQACKKGTMTLSMAKYISWKVDLVKVVGKGTKFILLGFLQSKKTCFPP